MMTLAYMLRFEQVLSMSKSNVMIICICYTGQTQRSSSDIQFLRGERLTAAWRADGGKGFALITSEYCVGGISLGGKGRASGIRYSGHRSRWKM